VSVTHSTTRNPPGAQLALDGVAARQGGQMIEVRHQNPDALNRSRFIEVLMCASLISTPPSKIMSQHNQVTDYSSSPQTALRNRSRLID